MKSLVHFPSTSASSNSNNNNNSSSVHNNHRILKERNELSKISMPLLPPFSSSSSSSSSSSFTVNNNSSLMSVSNSNNSNEVVVLRKRVLQLEADNERLRVHVSHAEDAIQGYRGFLSVRTSDGSNQQYHNRKTMDTSMQTDASFLADNGPNAVDSTSSQSRITMLEGLLKNSQQQCGDMKNESNKLKEKCMRSNEAMSSMQTEASVLRSQIASLKIELVDVHNRLSTVNQHDIMKKGYQRNLVVLSEELDKLKASLVNLKQQTVVEAEDLFTHMQRCMAMILKRDSDAVGDLNTKLQEACDTIAARDSKVNALLEKVSSLNDMLHEKDEEIDVLKSTVEIKSVLSESCDQACDPLSPLSNRQSKVNELEAAHQKLREEVTVVSESLDSEKRVSEDLLVKLKSISDNLLTLQESYCGQIDAAKHIAHVKDLVRVSSIREMSIERDRIIGDLKHYKELCNILSFSLSTSEQALKETQPQVVEKLVEGRTKRILSLEKLNKERKKDIDQRSAETCAVSSSHLESFTVKAQSKYDMAEELTKHQLNELESIFKSVNISLSLYTSKKK